MGSSFPTEVDLGKASLSYRVKYNPGIDTQDTIKRSIIRIYTEDMKDTFRTRSV